MSCVFPPFPIYLLYRRCRAEYERKEKLTMINKINPEIAAHNIATAFCECQIQKLPESAFIPGDIEHSGKAAKEIMQLYANIYDFVFEAALQENEWSTDEE